MGDARAEGTCERRGRRKPDVRLARDVQLYLCDSCWDRTPSRAARRRPGDEDDRGRRRG